MRQSRSAAEGDPSAAKRAACACADPQKVRPFLPVWLSAAAAILRAAFQSIPIWATSAIPTVQSIRDDRQYRPFQPKPTTMGGCLTNAPA